MRKLVPHALWLGNASDLRRPSVILDAGIQVVMELADNEPAAVLPRSLVRLRFPLADGAGNSPWLLELACRSLRALINAKAPALVCCSGGMSRSVAVAAAALALAEQRTLEETLPQVADTGPADVSAGLVNELHSTLRSIRSHPD